MMMPSPDRRSTKVAFYGLAAAFAVVSFLPWADWLGVASVSEAAHLRVAWVEWLLWLAAAIPLSILIVARWRGRVDSALDAQLSKIGGLSPARFGIATAALLLIFCVAFAQLLFERNPHLVDTIAQLFQARIFASGSLTAPAPEHLEFFAASHLVHGSGRWFSQYPPGHPALLAVGWIFRAPWLVNPALAALTLGLMFGAARRILGRGRAKLATILFLISPFALFMSASYMNHVSSAFFLTLALYSVARARERNGGLKWPAVAGLALGLAANIRPLDAAAWSVALGLWVLIDGGWRPAVWMGLACAIGVIPLLAYNALTTGHPLLFGYNLLWGEGHGLGFHTDPWGQAFTPAMGFANTSIDFQRLNILLLGLPLPGLVFLIAALVAAGERKDVRQIVIPLAALLLAAPFAYFFYWHRDNYLGPRFIYASLVPAIMLAAIGLSYIDGRLGRWRSSFRITLAASAVYALGVSLPVRAGTISGLEPELKLHPERELRAQSIESGLVLVKVGWGSRLIGRLWGWGVSASETEVTFRVVDGCRLQLALDAADSTVLAGTDSARALFGLRALLASGRRQQLPVVEGLLPDNSVRVDTTVTLSDACLEEAAQDTSGFTLYGSLVWRQDPALERGVVYARDLGPGINERLFERYGDRPWYRFAPVSPVRGSPTVLSPVTPAGR